MVRTFGATIGAGSLTPSQSPGWSQLIYATRGLLTVVVDRELRFVPAHKAVWIPPRVSYSLELATPVTLRSVYLAARVCRSLPRVCLTMNVSSFLREVILRTVRIGALHRTEPRERHLIAVLLDELGQMRGESLQIPLPADSRALRASEILRREPGLGIGLSEIARRAGAGVRTLERLFRAETGLTFGQWRQRMRVMHALRLLAHGRSVAETAADAGYASTSAFIAVFRQELGATPGKYFSRGP